MTATSALTGIWLRFTRLTALGFPQRFPVVQFPNLTLIVALLSGQAADHVDGAAHSYLRAVAYAAMTIWAYDELTHGSNWFRRLLGLSFTVIMVMRIAHLTR